MSVSPKATMTYRQPRYTPFSDCWATSAATSLIQEHSKMPPPRKRGPRLLERWGSRSRGNDGRMLLPGAALLPVQALPGEVLLRLDEVHHRKVGVLALGVEGDAARGDFDVLELRKLRTDSLGVPSAPAHRLGDQQDRVVGMRVDVRRHLVGAVLRLERLDEVLHHLALLV